MEINTEIIQCNPLEQLNEQKLKRATQLIQDGEVVAFPTETVYGLGANAMNSSAVSKIFQAKGRPSDNPLIVHISSFDMLKDLVSEKAFPKPGTQIEKLCSTFWPGAITFLFEKSDKVPDNVTAGQPTVAVRMPSHPVARALIEYSKVPIAAPSANVSGRPSPTKAEHVLEDLRGIIKCVVDGGSTNFGVESTVLDINRSPPLILRPGGVTFEQLQKILPDVQVYEKKVHGSQLEQAPPTPGLKYRHYSPTANVVLLEEGSLSQNDPQAVIEKMRTSLHALLKEELNSKHKVGVIHTHSALDLADYRNDSNVVIHPLGDENHPEIVAQGIFNALRELDNQKVDVILVEGISERNEGLAVMNRIRKAASRTLVCS